MADPTLPDRLRALRDFMQRPFLLGDDILKRDSIERDAAALLEESAKALETLAQAAHDTIADLPRLINERDALSDRIRSLQQRKRAAFAKFKVGDRIEWKHGLNGKRQGIVRYFCGYDHSAPDYVVDPVLKNGSKSRPFIVRSWHQPTLVDAAS